jgi:hypothetical protein
LNDLHIDKGADWSNLYATEHAGKQTLRMASTLMLMNAAGIAYFTMTVYRDLTNQEKLFPPSYRWWDVWSV